LLQNASAGAGAGLNAVRYSADNGGPVVALGKSRGATLNTQAAVVSNDVLGQISGFGSDGTDYFQAAQLGIEVDGTVTTGVVPARFVFSVRSTGAVTEQLRLTSGGNLAYRQAAPTSKSAAATLTVAELQNRIIQYTGAAATLTLPTGTLTEGGFADMYSDMTFEWSVINTGSGICTIGAGTAHTIVGAATIAIGASGRFASRRSAANTFISYRLS
jgi:hypothetical protein